MNYRTIQTMLLPDTARTNYGLYYQGTDGVSLSEDGKGLVIPAGSRVCFFTFFNGFYKKQWEESTDIADFRVNIYAEGNCRFSFCHAEERQERIQDLTEDWNSLIYGENVTYHIPQWKKAACQVCYLEAEGLEGGGILRDFRIEAACACAWPVRPAVVICTYKREADVKRNLARLAAMGENVRPAVFLVDNGNTLGNEKFPEFVRYVPNKNSGGTGGFTRGILEVLKEKASDFTHIVLMDDDIILETGVLDRTWSFLSCIKEELRGASLAGSLLQRDIPWQQYECGAVWNRGRIVAGKHATDLRRKESLMANMRREPIDYGGWWYCCFPVEKIRKKGLPLPFFVHRDDIEYGMRMGQVLVLNGIGVWHEAFEKKLPQTAEYYDIRNMAIVNAIYTEKWNAAEWKWFLRKWTMGNVLRGRYEYVSLNLHGALDFLKGEAWLRETDAVKLHQKLSEQVNPLISKEEILPNVKKKSFCTDPGVSVYKAALKRKIIYEDSTGKCLITSKSIVKSLNCFRLLRKTEKKINDNFDRARESYRQNYHELTSISFWKKYLEM